MKRIAIILLSLSCQAMLTAEDRHPCASVRDGEWSDAATWATSCVPKPVDLVRIDHRVGIRGEVTAGNGGPTDSDAIVIGANGALVVSGLLRLKGDLETTRKTQVSDAISLEPGGGIEFDPPAEARYRIFLNQNAALRAEGLPDKRCSIRTSRSAAGMPGWLLSTAVNTFLSAHHCDFARLNGGKEVGAMYLGLNGADNRCEMKHCTIRESGHVRVGLYSRSDVHVVFDHVLWEDEADQRFSLYIIGENGENKSGTRIVSHCTMTRALTWGIGNLRDFSITDSVMYCLWGGGEFKVGPAKWERNLIVAGSSGGTPIPALVMRDCYNYSEPRIPLNGGYNNYHGIYSATAIVGDYLISGNIWEHSQNGGDGEFTYFTYMGKQPVTICYENNLFLPCGDFDGCMVVATTPGDLAHRVTWSFRHNTFKNHGRCALYTGENDQNRTNQIAELKSNIFWDWPSIPPRGFKYASYATPKGKATDTITMASIEKNVGFNYLPIWKGVMGADNQANGYAAKWSGVPGTADLEVVADKVGTGLNPHFLDTTRSLATFSKAYLKAAPTRGAWTDHTAYEIGDVVEAASPDYYQGSPILYLCISGHTSDGTSVSEAKPGPKIANEWHKNWEFYTLQVIRQAIPAGKTLTDESLGLNGASYIEGLRTWVREGFRPQNEALHAAHDDVAPTHGWVGAVEGIPKK
jgi:hypothetical protein